MTKETIGWIAAGISFLSNVPYIVEYVGGRTKTHPLTAWMWKYLGLHGGTTPRQSSWVIWAILQYIIFTSSREQGATDSTWITFGYFFGSSVNVIIMFWYGSKKWKLLDISCVVLAVVCFFLLYGQKDPFWALLLAIIADGIGSIPTAVSVTINPESESRVGWTIAFIGLFINFFAMKEFNFEESAFSVYLVFAIGYIVYFVWKPRNKKEKILRR